MHDISGSIEPITLIWVSLQRSFTLAELEYRLCHFWSVVMMPEVEQRPTLVTTGYGRHRRQWVNANYNKVPIQRALWLAETACFIREGMHGLIITVSWLSNFCLEFWQIWAKLNIPCDSDKLNGKELCVRSKYGSQRPLLATVVLKLYQSNKFC